jgi:hypothetical protein
VICKARVSAPRGRARATLHVFGLPLCILSLVGCRAYDDHRYRWHDGYYGGYGYNRYHGAPSVPHAYQPVQPLAPPVFVAPRPPPLPPQPHIIVRPPPERHEHHHRHDDRPAHAGRDRGQHLNGGPDHKRNR